MKVKTSITITKELLASIDELFDNSKNRSQLIEKAIKEYIERQKKRKRDLEDLALINKKADKLNQAAAEVLSYQVDL